MLINVRSAAIYWQEQTLEITDTSDNKHTVPLTTRIRVKMICAHEEEKTMQAYELGEYMAMGCMIEHIEIDVQPE